MSLGAVYKKQSDNRECLDIFLGTQQSKCCECILSILYELILRRIAVVTSPPELPRPRRGRARYCNAHVCLSVCLCVCPCFRKISKCNISAISQPIIMKLGIHITYGYTVTDKYFQNFRSKVKVVGRRKVKNVIWPCLGNEWS